MKKKMLMRLMTATLAMSMLIQSNFGPVASMFPYYLPNVVFASEDSNSDTSLSELESVDIEIEEVETSTDSSVSSELLEPENEEQSSSLNVDDSVNNDENQSSETEESNEDDESNGDNNGEENLPLKSTSSPILDDSKPTENAQIPTESPVPTELPNQDTENKTEFDGTIEPTLTPSPIPTTEASDMVEQVLPSVSPSATPTATIAAGDFVLENKEKVVLEEQIISAYLKAASVVVKGNLPEGAVVNVVELNTEDYLPLLAKYYGVPVENVFCTVVLDITIENENEVFQPKAHDETVEVTIENIEAADAQQDVLHLEGTEANDQNEVNNAEIVENINVEQIELVGTVADESTSACFETESFSIYVIGGVEYDSEDGIYLENEYATAHLFDDGTLYVESFLQNPATPSLYPYEDYADSITSVSFSDTITNIGDFAFYEFTNISGTLTIPTTITSIGQCAFWGTNITSLDLGEAVAEIGDKAFASCNNLNTIQGGDGIEEIGTNSFLCVTVDYDTQNVIYPDELVETSITTENEILLNYDWVGDYRTIPNDVKFDGNYKGFESLFSLYPNSTDTYYYVDDDGTLWFYGNNSSLDSYYTKDGSNANILLTDNVDLSTIISVKFTSDCGTINIVDATGLFKDLTNCTSIDLSKFNTSACTKMYNMFDSCKSLSSLDVSNFDTSNVTNMCMMFDGCKSLSSLNLSKWNVENVTDMSYMFSDCESLTILDLSNFNSKLIKIRTMFENCTNLSSIDISNIDTANCTDMYGVFYNCSNLKSVDVSNFNTSKVTTFQNMFSGCSSLTSLDVSGFDTSNVTKMLQMFFKCESLKSLDIASWNTEKVTTMYSLFFECKSLSEINVSNWETKNVTDIGQMFYKCENITSLDLSKWNTEKVINMGALFRYCKKLTTVDLSNFNTSNVTKMGSMFDGCTSLDYVDISKFDTSKVISMNSMFNNCKISEIDISHFSFSNIEDGGFSFSNNIYSMFGYCKNLKKIKLPAIDLKNKSYFVPDASWVCEDNKTTDMYSLLVGSDPISAGTYYKASKVNVNYSYDKANVSETKTVYVPIGQCLEESDVAIENATEPVLYEDANYTTEYSISSAINEDKTLYALYNKRYILNTAKDLYGVLDTKGVLHIQGTGTELDRLLGGCIGLENAVSLKGIVFETDTIEIICNSWCSSYSTSTTVDGETVLVSTFENLTGDLILPKNLKSIGEKTFTDTTFNGSLYMPECITNIGSYAFYNTKFTSELNIPDSLTTIEDGVFGNTCFTGPLEIPTSVSTIGKYAFSDSKGFTGDLIIPNTVTEIGVAAFSHCEGFDGRLIIGTGLTKISETCFAGMPNISGDLIIPENIKEIEAYAFYTNTEDSHKFEGGKLVLPSAITYIGNRTFDNCKFTGELNIPDEVETIGKEAFEKNCFTSLKLPSNLKTIDEYAFYKCNSIVGDLIIPNGVTSIGASAFSKSYSNDNGNYILNLPDSLIAVGRSAFSYNDFSGTLKIPKNLEIVEWGSFSSNNFDEIILGENTTTLCKYAFQANNISYIVIPDSITELQSKCFSACYDLEKIYIGNGLEIIEEGAFSRSGSQYKTKLLTENEVALTYNWENDNRIILPMNTFVIGVPQEISLKAKYPDVNGSPIWYSEFDMEIQGDFEDGSYGELGGVSSFTIFSEDGDSREVVTNIEDMRVDEDGTITIPITLKADNPTLIKEFSGNLNVSTVLHELFPTLDEAS